MSDISVLPDQGQNSTFAYRIDYRPAFALASLTLAAEQPIKAQAGAMVSMGGNVELASKMEGGLWGAVKRSVGGRSAFVSTYTAHGAPGELTLAPAAPGDIVPLGLSGEAYNIAALVLSRQRCDARRGHRVGRCEIVLRERQSVRAAGARKRRSVRHVVRGIALPDLGCRRALSR